MKDQEDSTNLIMKKSSEIEIRPKDIHLQKRIVRTWTSLEDKKLVELYNQYPKKWNKISEMIPNRSQNQCLHRFRRLTSTNKNKKIWSPQEDKTVLEMYEKYGNNWKIIAMALKTKNGKQIRERFINKLDPQIKRQQWTKDQDRKIVQLLAKFGSKWSQMSKFLPGRPQNRIKNRFYSHIQKNYGIYIKNEQSQPNEQFDEEISQKEGKGQCSNIIYSSFKKNLAGVQQFRSQINYKENKKANNESVGKENKQNGEREEKNIEDMETFGFRKYLDEEWGRESPSQEIQEPNQIISFEGQNGPEEDLFYFQEN